MKNIARNSLIKSDLSSNNQPKKMDNQNEEAIEQFQERNQKLEENNQNLQENESEPITKFGGKTLKINQQDEGSQGGTLNSLLGKNNFAMYICVLVDDDSDYSVKILKVTLKAILRSIEKLLDFGFTKENVLVCCFINYLKDNLFCEDIPNDMKETDRLISYWKFSYGNGFDEKDLNFLITTGNKNVSFSQPESLAFFHNQIIPQLSKRDILYIANIKSGIEFSEDNFKNLLKACSDKNGNKNCVSVPVIETNSILIKGIWGKLLQYENVHYQIYDLNYFDMSGCVPIDHRCNIMQLDSKSLSKMRNFYNTIPLSSYIEHCDYSLALSLTQNSIEVRYCDSIIMKTNDSNISYSDYMDCFTKRHGGNFSCIIELMKNMSNCKECTITNKLVLILEIIGMLFKFIQPSLTCMVTYTVFADGFNTNNKRPAVFLTAFLGILFVISGISSLISKRPQYNSAINFIFFIIFEVYYFFILVVSICAIHFINKKKPDEEKSYEFNTPAMVTIIVLNFIFGIIPLIISFQKLTKNIINMFLYLLIGASNSNSHFMMNYIHQISAFRGTSNIEKTKTLYLIMLYLINCLFGFLTLCNKTRKGRVTSVIVLASIFTAYNILKMIIIITRQLLISSKIQKTIEESNNPQIMLIVRGNNDFNDQFFQSQTIEKVENKTVNTSNQKKTLNVMVNEYNDNNNQSNNFAYGGGTLNDQEDNDIFEHQEDGSGRNFNILENKINNNINYFESEKQTET